MVLQRPERGLKEMSAIALYGKVVGLMRTSAPAPVTGGFTVAGGPQSQDKEIVRDAGFATSQIWTPTQLWLSVTLSKLLALSEPQFPQLFKKDDTTFLAGRSNTKYLAPR